jgi:hypothetical protein
MTVATFQDVEVELGRTLASSAEVSQVTWWLAGIEALIGARLGDVTALDQQLLTIVEVSAVAAKVRRGAQTASSVTVAVDDGSVTRRYDNPVSLSDITDEWWSWLDPDTGAGVFSFRPTFEVDTARWPAARQGTCDPEWMDGWCW